MMGRLAGLLICFCLLLSACAPRNRTAAGGTSPDAELGPLTVYSGRTEELVGPLIEEFRRSTGIEVRVRYGDTAELAATILEEGKRSPADLFLAQDAGALGALGSHERFEGLPSSLLQMVPSSFRSPQGEWLGVSGRARTVVYNTASLGPGDLPGSILQFADPKWKAKIGWAPTNGSFQAFVTALRLMRGEVEARRWLEAIKDNGARSYPRNLAIVQAVGAGEVQVGLVNHYYLFQARKQDPAITADNHFSSPGDPGALVNVAGVGILGTSKAKTAALRFIEFLLSDDAQRYFTQQTFEYPLVRGVDANPALPPLASLQPPDIDLSDLEDLEGTLELLREVGLV